MVRMMVVVFVVLSSSPILGASASWSEIRRMDDFWVDSGDQIAKITTLIGGVRADDGAGATVQGMIFTKVDASDTYIKAYDYSGTAAPVNTRWLLALHGDILDASTLASFRSVELTISYDYVGGGDKIVDPSDFYLIFVAEDWDDYVSGAANPHRWYGWVNLAVNADGWLDVLGSDIAVYGDVLTVGGGSSTPEPSGGLLLVLGAATLALRRKSGMNGLERKRA